MTAYTNAEGSGSYRLPRSRLDEFEFRLRRLELGMLEVKWMVRLGALVGLWQSLGVGPWFHKILLGG